MLEFFIITSLVPKLVQSQSVRVFKIFDHIARLVVCSGFNYNLVDLLNCLKFSLLLFSLSF